jgi:hypothetical protein
MSIEIPPITNLKKTLAFGVLISIMRVGEAGRHFDAVNLTATKE